MFMKTNSISNGLVSGQAFTFSGLRHALTIVLMLLGVVAFAQTSAQPSETYEVKGVVLSVEENTALTGVNIYLKDTNVGTFSDVNGKFTFPRKLKTGETLVFSFVGLKKQEYTVTSNMPQFIEIRMEEDPLNVLGEVWMDAPAKSKQKRRSSAH
jgi:hypothetical protein